MRSQSGTKPKILMIEDEVSFTETVALLLREDSVEIVSASTGAAGLQRFKASPYDFALIILDYCLPDLKGTEVASTIRKLNPTQEILFATGHNDPGNLIDLLETGGGRGFIYKGRPTGEIRRQILALIQEYRTARRLIGDQLEPSSLLEGRLRKLGMIGRSWQMGEMLETLERCRKQEYPTLIVGETGTGKELIANAFVPTGKQLITIDCTRFSNSESRIEADLFGFVKGAYTGADRDTPGLIARAHGQVLFLDELHTLTMDSQTKLLRFLQEMKYRRLGDHSARETPVTFRLVAAAKPHIFEMIRKGEFLEDLYHRVAKLEVRVPVLNEREGDLEPLLRAFETDFNKEKPPELHKRFRSATVQAMEAHIWTGNIRQLQNAAIRMMTLAQGAVIEPSDFRRYLNATGAVQASNASLKVVAQDVEAQHIERALRISRTKAEAATRLGMTRWSLDRSMSRLGIESETYLLKTR